MATLEFTYEITDSAGDVSTHTKASEYDAATKESAFDHFFATITNFIHFRGTSAVKIVKIVKKASARAADFVAVPTADFNIITPEKYYRLLISGRTFGGDDVSQTVQYKATSGAGAMLAFWNALKTNGAGFCDMAAQVTNLTITVLARPEVADEVIFEAVASATDAAPLSSGAREFGNVSASYDSERNRARIVVGGVVHNYTGVEAWAEYLRYRGNPSLQAGNGNLFRALDHVTNYVNRHSPSI